MRIGLLCNNFQPRHGWATLAVDLGRALVELGVEVVALCATDDGPPQGWDPTDRRAVLPSLAGRALAPRLLAAGPRLAAASRDCDLLLAIAEPYALACGPATRRRPVAVCACGTYVPLTCEIGTFRHFYRRAYQRCHLTAISRYTAGRVAEWLPAPVRVITPGVDFQRYQPGGQPPLDPGPWVVTAGGVKSRKGTAVLVSAMAEVVKQVPNARLAVIGTLPEDEYASRVKQSIAENGLAERVTLTGHIPFEELLGYYHAATAFALPSVSLPQRFEGFGLVLLEAQAAGAPAIGARDCGNEDALLPGQTGFLMEQHNHEELACHLVTLLTDTELRQRMSAAAREYAASRDWSRVGAEYLAWFEEVIAAGPA